MKDVYEKDPYRTYLCLRSYSIEVIGQRSLTEWYRTYTVYWRRTYIQTGIWNKELSEYSHRVEINNNSITEIDIWRV